MGNSVPISGTLTSLRLYKSIEANVSLSEENLYQTLDSELTNFTDSETSEGITYYYKLTGTLDNGTEALVSAEVNVLSDDATIVLMHRFSRVV